MATLTIRSIDEAVKRKLQLRAVFNGRSMESEARAILLAAASQPLKPSAAVKASLGPAMQQLLGSGRAKAKAAPKRKTALRRKTSANRKSSSKK